MPYFSVIIPVYNKGMHVGQTLKSVLGQSFPDYEIVVVNDGSTDDSDTVIHSVQDERIRYFSKYNEGVAVARNFGLSKASGTFICFLDADDIWYPEFLATMKLAIDRFPNQQVFASAIDIETQNKTFPAQYSIAEKTPITIVDFFDASRQECVLWTSSTVFHQSVFEKAGNFDEKIKKGEDTELWMRIGLLYPVVFIRTILAKYVYDANGISRNFNYYFEPYVFEKYSALEKENPKLKSFLDLNRFSAVIKCKLNGDMPTAKKLYKQINLDTLGWKKVIILQLPSVVLHLLVALKNTGAAIGLGKSVFI